MKKKSIFNLFFIILLLFTGLKINDKYNPEKISRPKPAFRIIFSNDTTNILSCESPYHKRGEPFSQSVLNASVDETINTGIDVHMLQPGMGWVPWWKSSVYPYKEHAKWYRQRFQTDVSEFGKYMLKGGDIVADFINRCREKNMNGFISLRMNDRHYKHVVDFTSEEYKRYHIVPIRSFAVSKFYLDHPDFRIGNVYDLPPRKDMSPKEYSEKYMSKIQSNNILNWVIPEVREQKLDYIREICENYNINGFELDFVRHKWLFDESRTTSAHRKRIMTDYIKTVRKILDETSLTDKYRWLCVRVPFRLSDHDRMGLDIKMWHEAGVDMFNLSCDYVMEQQNDLYRIHQTVPDAILYIESSQTVLRYQPRDKSRLMSRSSPDLFIMTKFEQFYTLAHLAYQRGAQGVSVFNFVYYRNYGERRGGTVAEPPFEIFNIIRDPLLTAKQPQHYYLSYSDYNSKRFKQKIVYGFNETFAMDMAPPTEGWKNDGRLRIQMEPSFGRYPCYVFFNGKSLKSTNDISEPYPTEYQEGLGNKESLRAWVVPEEIVTDGINKIRINFPDGCDGEMVFLDIGIQ
ncbi:MAG: hypothetical protein JXB50_16360 [Spirochaetes bacterium]|nr:hypothetical protein [Spirochaetota bacterium]